MIINYFQHYNHSKGYYGKPHDSTLGVPNFVFIGIWLLILIFFLRLTWEFRDKIFVKNHPKKIQSKAISRKKW